LDEGERGEGKVEKKLPGTNGDIFKSPFISGYQGEFKDLFKHKLGGIFEELCPC
jgi:hypothetical protein